MRLLITTIAVVLLSRPGASWALDGGLAGGVYSGGMLVGFDPATAVVTGYFSDQTGQGQFSCVFYLKGALVGSEAAVSTYFPATPVADLIKGKLVVTSRSGFRVRLAAEHGGCWNVEHFADDKQPAEFSLDTAHPWASVAVVKRDRVYFYDDPGSATHRKGYVVKGDGVGVLEARPGWLWVDYVGGDRPVSGWIKRSDVYPIG